MSGEEKINYVEFPASELEATKRFFSEAFGWRFSDYGRDYSAFFDAGLNGGFYRSERVATVEQGSALVVLYSTDLELTQNRVERAGGRISQAIFAFPGGRRFHFTDPSGNEFGVWSDKGE